MGVCRWSREGPGTKEEDSVFTVVNGEVVTEEQYKAAGVVQRMQWRWDALVAAHNAAEAFGQLVGATWTGRVAQVS